MLSRDLWKQGNIVKDKKESNHRIYGVANHLYPQGPYS